MTDLAGAMHAELSAGPPSDSVFSRGWGSNLAGSWTLFWIQRILGLAFVAIFLALATFAMVRVLPGDPAAYIASAGGAEASPERIAEIKGQTGLDKPFFEQFANYLGHITSFDFGDSFQTREPVSAVISRSVGPSLRLGFAALVVVLLVGFGGGMLMGHLTRGNLRPRTEVAFTGIASVIGAIPDFLLATFLTFVFAVTLEWLPVAGDDGVQSLVLPALALSVPPAAILMRIVRVETLNVLAQDYIRTARSKRLSNRRIYLRHVLPNVATAALTIGGVLFASLIGGAVVVETLFARPGLGSTLVDAVLSRDYPRIQAVMLVLGIVVVAINTVVDFVLAVVDPRTRTGAT